MNLLIDENLPSRWCAFLATFGITATHWTDVGQTGAPDDILFDYAATNRLIILTQDLDFTRMLALRGCHLPSVIQLRVPCPTPELAGTALIHVLEDRKEQLESGCLVSLDIRSHRVRLLPLR